MPELVLHVITEPATDLDAVAADLRCDLEKCLRTANADGAVMVEKEQPLLGAPEILTIVSLVFQGIDVAEKLLDRLRSHRRGRNVTGIEVEVDGQRVPIERLTDREKALLRALLDEP